MSAVIGIVLLLICVIAYFVSYHLSQDKKTGGTLGCGGSCAGCAEASHCNLPEKNTSAGKIPGEDRWKDPAAGEKQKTNGKI